MIASANAFYRELSGREDLIPLVFVSTADVAQGPMPGAHYASKWATTANLLWLNSLEALRARIKRRAPLYRAARTVQVASPGPWYLNLNNGTAVILGDDFVDKFYFKDAGFFADLYGSAFFAGMPLFRGPDYLVVRQTRYRRPASWQSDAALMVSVRPLLDEFSRATDLAGARQNSLSVRYKVVQLFQYYSPDCGAALADYLEAADRLDQCGHFGRGPCHGDLWSENILEDAEGRVALVDYDKAIVFSRAYDYVYYYLMSRVLPALRDVAKVLRMSAQLENGAISFLRDECAFRAGVFERTEVRSCIILFAFLKLVERDLRHRQHGKSVEWVQAELDSMSSLSTN